MRCTRCGDYAVSLGRWLCGESHDSRTQSSGSPQVPPETSVRGHVGTTQPQHSVGGSMEGLRGGQHGRPRGGQYGGDCVGGSMGDCVGAAWGDRVGGSMADHVWVEPTYPCESTVSRAPSSSPDRVEKSFRRMGGSRAGWRQLLRMGTSWGKASPRAGPRAQTGASFLCGRRMGGRSPAATLAASGGACWARPADIHPQLREGCSQHRTPGSASPFDPPPTMALIVRYVSFLFFPTSYQILKKI